MSKKNEKKEEVVKVRIYNSEQIDRGIVSVGTVATSLKVKIHSLAVSTLKIWHDAKEDKAAAIVACTRLNALQSASPYHSKAFSKWVQEFTNLHWSKEKSCWYVNTAEENRVMGKTFIAARDTPFWKVSPPSPAQPMMLEDLLTALVTRIEKRMDNPVEGDVINKAALKHLREAVKASHVE
jgi:hypothetical protein